MLQTSLSLLTILAYLGLAFAYLRALHETGRVSPNRLHGVSVIVLGLHMTVLYGAIDTPQGHNLSAVNIFSLILWLGVILTLLANLRKPLLNLFPLLYPVAAVSVSLVALSMGSARFFTDLPAWQIAHVWLSGIGLAFLLLSGIQACVLILHNFLLKRKSSVLLRFQNVPMLTMERGLSVLMMLTWLSFAIVLVSSVLFAPTQWTGSATWKFALSGLTWLGLTTLAWGQVYRAWRGLKIYYSIVFINLVWLLGYSLIA